MIPRLIERGRSAARQGRWDAALEAYENALARMPRGGTPAAVAEVLRLIGVVHHQRGHLELAIEAYELCYITAHGHGLRSEEAAALICLAATQQHLGDGEKAEAIYGQAQAIAAEIADEPLLAAIEHNLGILANIRGDIGLALARYRSAVARHRRLGDLPKVVGALNNLGMAYVDLGQWRLAARHFNQASELAIELGDDPMRGSIEVNRTELYLRSGKFDKARTSCDRAFEIFSRLGAEAGVAEVYKFYGVLYRETSKPQLADSHFESAVSIARRCGDRLLEAEALSEWAMVHRTESRNREALHCLNEAYHIFSALGAGRELLDLDRRLDGLETSYLEVVRTWGESIESKDGYTAGHCERVANYACMLAEAVGLSGRDITWLRMGGYLHDVGKIAVPAEVLNKPGKLTPEEWKLMQSHTTEGDAIVAELDFPWDIRPIVRSHHERWDGSGYPDGLAGEEIPLTARIMCIADVYDALTTARSYRGAMSRAQALEIMTGDVGRIFDPSLFPIFVALLDEQAPSLDARFPAFAGSTAAA